MKLWNGNAGMIGATRNFVRTRAVLSRVAARSAIGRTAGSGASRPALAACDEAANPYRA